MLTCWHYQTAALFILLLAKLLTKLRAERYLGAENLHSCGKRGEEERSRGTHAVPQHQHALVLLRHQAQPVIVLLKAVITACEVT